MSRLPSSPVLENESRPLALPAPIARYFAADRSDAAGLADCFAPDAVVKDEGHTYAGIDDIKRWKQASSSTYDYTSEPIRAESADGLTIVTGHVSGNFPGSPVDLRYVFKLEGDRIVSLEIIP
ncbi:MAG: nuclear transport factor 2 family protein [Rhizobiales bacterium]|nr:nuclear transport factor 2 family protein [Hyphomicrobiales bacterium]